MELYDLCFLNCWFYVRRIHCSLADSLTGDQKCGTVLFDNAFCIADGTLMLALLKVSTLLAQCVVSPFVPILITKEPKFWCLLSRVSKRAVEQTVEMQMSWKRMKFRLCYCYVICHSVIDDIIVPVCGENIYYQWISVARDHWSWTLVVQSAAISSPVDSSHKSSAWCFLVCLTQQAV